jgi:magnesium-transporting ATPase (P-type)
VFQYIGVHNISLYVMMRVQGEDLMTPNLWITVLIFVGTTVVTFSVAYMHRKQIRQVELYRRDTSSGLKPPPHPITRFLREHWWETILVIWSLYHFVRWFIEESQHSYHAGVSAALAFWMVMNLVLSGMYRLFSRSLDITGLALADTEMLIGVISSLVADLKEAGHLSKGAQEKIDSELRAWKLTYERIVHKPQ